MICLVSFLACGSQIDTAGADHKTAAPCATDWGETLPMDIDVMGTDADVMPDKAPPFEVEPPSATPENNSEGKDHAEVGCWCPSTV